MSRDLDRKRRIRDAWHGVWDEGNIDALDAMLGPGYVRHGRTGDQGSDALKRSIAAVRAAFPDLVTTIDQLVAEDDLVAIRWHSRGTHRGMFRDVPATHRTVTVTGMTMSRFDGPVIVEEWVTWNPVDLFTSLGILILQEIE